MRTSDFIDWLHDMPMLPIILTENSKSKPIRVVGILVYAVWFFPAVAIWIFIAALLAIPAMIQDA